MRRNVNMLLNARSLSNKPNSSDSHYLYELYDEAPVQPKSHSLRPGNSILSVKLPVNLDDEKPVSIPDIKKASYEDISAIRKDLTSHYKELQARWVLPMPFRQMVLDYRSLPCSDTSTNAKKYVKNNNLCSTWEWP